MNAEHDKIRKGPWSRPEPEAPGPKRNFGGYYRTADRDLKGHHLRGVPLQTAEDTAVAAVRLGYQVIDAQIERGLDMARRLRKAADRAGVGDTRDVLTAAERLISKGTLLGLEFLESAANRPENPLMRLFSAEYRLLGSLLGLNVAETTTPRPQRQAPTTSPAGDTETSPQRSPLPRRIRIKRPGPGGRAVVVVKFQVYAPLKSTESYPLTFYSTSAQSDTTGITATLTHTDKEGSLIVLGSPEPSVGRWRAAITASDGEQIGIVELKI